MATPYLGEIRLVGFGFAMDGWALCNGQLLSINQNTALFAILGANYGGNGVTTFALPNLQGRFPMHQGTGSGTGYVGVGQVLGSNGITLLANNLPAHTHALMATSEAPTTHGPSGAALASQLRSQPPIYSAAAANTTLAPAALATTGGGQPYSNLQPYLALNFVIALVGIFPSQN